MYTALITIVLSDFLLAPARYEHGSNRLELVLTLNHVVFPPE